MSMSELTTYSWSFDDDVYHYGRSGYESLGIWRAKLNDFGEERGVQLVQDSGLSVSSLAWIGGFTGSDGGSHDESVADGLRAIRLAFDLQAGCVITHTGGQGGHTAKHARRLVCQALSRLLPLAEELNVTLALEPMHPRCAGEWTFLTSLEDALGLILEMRSRRLKLVWDTYQLWHEANCRTRVLEVLEHVALVQLSDARVPHTPDQERCRLGTGRGDWDRALQHFLSAGYDGWWEVEILGPDVNEAGYPQVLEHSLSAVSELVPSLSS
jgi:sugar phosphate isomerase/epimerase